MGELYNPFPRLPKNIRQIGERDQTVRLYLEDYVNTYLKRLYPKGGQDLRVGVLLGTAEEREGTPYLFVDGALEIEDVTERGEKVVFTEVAWKKTYQAMEQMFPKRVILGWFLCGMPESTLSPLNYWKQHGQYFAEKNQLMYLNSGLDGDEAVYIASEDGFYRLRGYSIYYERNQMMQDYMILRKDVRRVESGTGETVIRDFRQRMEDTKSQVTARRSTIRVLSSLCSVLGILVLAGGVTMVSNYEKMQEMEAVLASVLPAGTVTGDTADGSAAWTQGGGKLSGKQSGTAGDSDGQAGGSGGTAGGQAGASDDGQASEVIVEEIRGQVYLTTAAETMSDEYPGGSDGRNTGKEDGAAPADGSDSSGAEKSGGQAGGLLSAGSGSGGASAGSGSGGTSAGSGSSGASAGNGNSGASAGNGNGGVSAGSGSSEASAGSGNSGASGGSGSGGASAGSGNGGASGGSGNGGASVGSGSGGALAGSGNGSSGTSAGSGNGGASAGNGSGGTSASAGNGTSAGTGSGASVGTGSGTPSGTGSSSGTNGGTSSGITSASAGSAAGQTLYQVQPGDTLYGICLKIYGDGKRMDEICRINNLESQDKIEAGKNLILP